MCDNVIVTPSAASNGVMLFGKNSDRERNEAQSVELFPGADHESGSVVKCTYITIPQSRRTHAVLLCRPFWIWGAEMGANEHGVVMGNEGIHARSPAPEAAALTGMDLVRLALERATTAAEAVEIVTALLSEYGQGGNCGHLTTTYYNNGFMIADARDAFVLETVGREWLIERVVDRRSMSNIYSITSNPLRTSGGLSDLMRESCWAVDTVSSYADVIANPNREHIGQACARRARTTSLLVQQEELSTSTIMALLRDHGERTTGNPEWNPQDAPFYTVCMHAGAENRPGQTTGSLASELSPRGAIHWVTGTAAPCISIFKPVLLDVPLPGHGPLPTAAFDPRTLWWRHERLHRSVIGPKFEEFVHHIAGERDTLESEFRFRMAVVGKGATVEERSCAVSACWADALEMERRWASQVVSIFADDGTPYRKAWSQMNRIAGLT